MDGVSDLDTDSSGCEVDSGVEEFGSGDARPVADRLLGERVSRKVDMAMPSTEEGGCPCGASGGLEATGGEVCKGLLISWTVSSAVLRGGVRVCTCTCVGAAPRLLRGRIGEFCRCSCGKIDHEPLRGEPG